MRIVFQDIPDAEVRNEALVVPLFEGKRVDPYRDLDRLVGGLLSKVASSAEFGGKQGQAALIHVKEIKSPRIVLVGLGKEKEVAPEKVRQAGGKAFSLLRTSGVRHPAISTRNLGMLPREGFGSIAPLYYFVEGGLLSNYRFEKFKKSEDGKGIRSLTVLSRQGGFPVERLLETISSVHLARDLVNTPPNAMTPSVLADTAKALAGKGLSVKVLNEKEVERKGLGAFLSVSRGSHQPPRFVVLQYRGKAVPPVVLIGKSITFDSGGISIKPSEGMEKMKYDMAGGAAVLGVLKAVAALGMPVHVVGILPGAENLPGGGASRPGDVVRSVNGKTIEIVSTDAEGRMTLADAMGYAIQYLKPAAIIDVATLTGACSIAFGNEAIAMMGNSGELMGRLKRASDETYERVWEMPLFEEYKEYLKSDTADLKNSGGRKGSLAASGYFLKEFAGDVPWVHLDIAGTAWLDKDRPYNPKGATGVGVRLLLNFLEEVR